MSLDLWLVIGPLLSNGIQWESLCQWVNWSCGTEFMNISLWIFLIMTILECLKLGNRNHIHSLSVFLFFLSKMLRKWWNTLLRCVLCYTLYVIILWVIWFNFYEYYRFNSCLWLLCYLFMLKWNILIEGQ